MHSQSFEARSSDEGVLVSETAVYSDALIQSLSDCEVDIEGQDTCRLKTCAFLGDLKGGTKEKEARKRGKRDPSSASWLKKDKQAFTAMGQLKATLLSSWLIWFLEPAIPAGFAVKYTNQSPVTTFAVNFVAIIPLSKILDVVTEELGIYKGGHVGMMIIITFGYDRAYTQCNIAVP